MVQAVCEGKTLYKIILLAMIFIYTYPKTVSIDLRNSVRCTRH